MDKRDTVHEDANKQEGVGRLSNPGKQLKEGEPASGDISQVDKQEGEMDHGEMGGNFNEQNSDNK